MVQKKTKSGLHAVDPTWDHEPDPETCRRTHIGPNCPTHIGPNCPNRLRGLRLAEDPISDHKTEPEACKGSHIGP